MKKISTLSLAFSFIGAFLGAGYISGQELYQFFAKFGFVAFPMIVVGISILAIFNLIIAKIVRTTGVASIDSTVVGCDSKPLLASVGVLENVIFFGTYVVTSAGAGALIKKLVGSDISYYIGSLAFCLVISFLAIKGISGIVTIFSFSVPILIGMTIVVSFSAVILFGKNGFDFSPSGEFNPLVPNPILGAVTFASYNLFCAVGVLCPIAERAKSKKSVVLGTVIGGIFLVLAACAVFLTLAVLPETKTEELPMLSAAQLVASPLIYVYAVLLLTAMAGASLACLVPAADYLAERFAVCRNHGAVVIFTLSLASFLLSCFGFADLVGTVFSSFGYVALIGLFGLARHCYKISKKSKQ